MLLLPTADVMMCISCGAWEAGDSHSQ